LEKVHPDRGEYCWCKIWVQKIRGCWLFISCGSVITLMHEHKILLN
jgi:hypothetical protein